MGRFIVFLILFLNALFFMQNILLLANNNTLGGFVYLNLLIHSFILYVYTGRLAEINEQRAATEEEAKSKIDEEEEK